MERIHVERPISATELAVVRAALERAPALGIAARLAPSLDGLRVIGRCQCGCDSVDFAKPDGQARSTLIADGIGTTPAGGRVGVIVWGTAEVVTGLEIYDMGAGAADLRLPERDSIRPFAAGAT